MQSHLSAADIVDFKVDLLHCRSRHVEHICHAFQSQEETQVPHRIHQPADLRAGEALPLPKIPIASGSRRNRRRLGPLQRTGEYGNVCRCWSREKIRFKIRGVDSHLLGVNFNKIFQMANSG